MYDISYIVFHSTNINNSFLITKLFIKKCFLMDLLKEDISRIKEIMGLNEEEMMEQGCADTEMGCIRKRDGGWVILNNKKGGVWRKCDSKKHCEDILQAMHVGEGEIDEQEEGGGEPAPSGPSMSTWETGLTRGKANPIDTTSKWETGVNRGKGNPVW